MTWPPIDTNPTPGVLTGAQWAAAQSAPASALLSGDPEKATTNGLGRPLTGDEWSQAQRMTAEQVKTWKIPALPVSAAPRDVTRTPADPNAKGKPIDTPIIGPVMRQLVDPVLEHPFESAAVGAAPFALPGVLGAAAAVGIGGAGVYHIAQYGWQKLAESQLDPETRKLAEADPERISGEAAAMQAIMLGLAPLVHVGLRGVSRAADVSGGLMEAGVQGLKETNFAPRFSEGFSDAQARSTFAAQLEAGARSATVSNDVKRPKGFEATSPATRAREIPRVQGLEVPEDVTAGRVKKTGTESPMQSVESLREQDAARAHEEAMRPRRRPGTPRAESESAPVFETPQGAEMLGAMAARHGMSEEANPYHPTSPLAPEWEAGHRSASESYPLYPEGFTMGGALTENRIPGDYEPARMPGFDPTELPDGVTPESLAAVLKPSRFRGHSADELVKVARSARETIDRAQAKLDEAASRVDSVRDADGSLRRNLRHVATDELHAEWARLAELNANDEAAHAGVQESGYRMDYEELPATEKYGHKGKEDLPDADGMVDPERLLADNKVVSQYNRGQAVRAARQRAMERLQREIDSRSGEDSFDFGLNGSDQSAGNGGEGPTVFERAITRAKGALMQVEREFALRGVTGDELARRIAPASDGNAPLPNALETVRGARDVLETARREGERRSLERAASTDELTGLANQRAWARVRDEAEADPETAIIRLDLNGLKNVNDRGGHAAGDAAIRDAGRVIREHAPGFAGRVGGDEYVLTAPTERADEILAAIQRDVGVRDVQTPHGTVRYSISGGVGSTEAEADAAAYMQKHADKAAQGIAERGAAQREEPSGSVQPPPIEGTGPTRTRGLSSSVVQTALANHLDLTVGELPEYRRLSMTDQASRAARLLAEDPDLAQRVARGESPAPRGLLPESVFVALERQAIEQGDVNTLRDLATSKLTGEATTMGQRIRALAERDPDSPVAAIQDVVNKRSGGAKNAEKVLRATDEEVDVVTRHLDAIPVESGALTTFLDTLRC
jgi:diguanylate cyclase (GGDEF)-like protein